MLNASRAVVAGSYLTYTVVTSSEYHWLIGLMQIHFCYIRTETDILLGNYYLKTFFFILFNHFNNYYFCLFMKEVFGMHNIVLWGSPLLFVWVIMILCLMQHWRFESEKWVHSVWRILWWRKYGSVSSSILNKRTNSFINSIHDWIFNFWHKT